jgi:ABC-type transporter Mla maintaining outer membrane lipid asymmetry ATPase subunit MlaF
MVDPLMARILGDLIRKLQIQLKLTSVVVTHDTQLAKVSELRYALAPSTIAGNAVNPVPNTDFI